MKQQKLTGWLLIAGAIGVLVPYTTLTIIFQYPNVLRQETGMILTTFNAGGNRLIFTWLAFALGGLPLVPAYALLGKGLSRYSKWVEIATAIGITGLVVQMIGLLRWVFVVPVLASSYLHAANDVEKVASIIAFKTIHQFAGVLLGEHLGQLFTIAWTFVMAKTFIKLDTIPKWVAILGLVASGIYFIAQAELLSTVMPQFPVWEMAGFLGSTLWLIWLVIAGVYLIRSK